MTHAKHDHDGFSRIGLIHPLLYLAWHYIARQTSPSLQSDADVAVGVLGPAAQKLPQPCFLAHGHRAIQ